MYRERERETDGFFQSDDRKCCTSRESFSFLDVCGIRGSLSVCHMGGRHRVSHRNVARVGHTPQQAVLT